MSVPDKLIKTCSHSVLSLGKSQKYFYRISGNDHKMYLSNYFVITFLFIIADHYKYEANAVLGHKKYLSTDEFALFRFIYIN